MGSGTKPYTATCIMRLVDEGKVKLADRATMHIDKPMRRMWNTSFAALFGPRAANVTVGQLITMRSGLGDFDVLSWDYAMLHSKGVHDPLLDLRFLANVQLLGPVRMSHHGLHLGLRAGHVHLVLLGQFPPRRAGAAGARRPPRPLVA